MQDAQTQSWSGLGVGTDRESFLRKVVEQLPDYHPVMAAEAVFCPQAPGGASREVGPG
ncbi:MAG TPA: hypothetical protein VF815_29490 [Myxococcaceae bacterium]|jgi:hypothetical protein